MRRHSRATGKEVNIKHLRTMTGKDKREKKEKAGTTPKYKMKET